MNKLDQWEALAKELIEERGNLRTRTSVVANACIALIVIVKKQDEILHKILLRTPILSDSEGFDFQTNELLEAAFVLTEHLK